MVKSDVLGISAASLCLIHCMVFPVVVLFGGAVHEHTHETWSYFDFFFLAIGLIAVYYSTRSSCSKSTRLAMWGTYATLTLAILFRNQLHALEYLAYIASLGLIISHLYNMYKGNSCDITLKSR